MTRLFCAAIAWMVLALPMVATASVVWFSTDENLFRADTTTNAIVQTLPIKGIASLAVDSQRAAWIVTTKHVSKFAADGSPLFQADLGMIGLMGAATIAVNPYDNSVWLVDQKTALRLDANGRPLFSIPAPGANARQIQIAPDESLWILGNKQLTHYSPSGSMIENFDLHAITTAEPKYFVVDKIGGSIWFAGEKELIQVDLVSAQHVLRRIALAEPVLGLVTQSTTGAIWVLGQDRLLMYDVTGTIVRNIDLKGQAITGVDTLVFDAVADCAWVTHKTGVARFSASTGQLLVRIVTQKSAEEVGVVPFTVLPQLSLIQPQTGLLTNNPLPIFALQYGALCNGQPCGFTNTYLSTYVLSATINSQMIGNLFGFDLATGKAAFTPVSRLPEGINTFAAQVRDRFGHFSDTVNSTFTVDTVPPTISVSSPADGTLTNLAAQMVKGSLSEAAILTINAQSVVTFPDYSFAKSITLTEGPNVFNLVATDLAGNIASRSLSITLDTIPPQFLTLIPSGNSLTNQTPFRISGRLNEPATLKIGSVTVPLATDNTFMVDQALTSGTNTIVVQANDLAGNTASRSLSITLDIAPPQFLEFIPSGPVLTNQSPIRISGRLNEPGTLKFGTITVPLSPNNTFTFDQALVSGLNTIDVQAMDLAGNTASRSILITLDTVPPAAVSASTLSFNTTAPNVVTVSAIAGSVEPGARVRITNVGTGQTIDALADASGAFSTQINGRPSDLLLVVVVDAAGNTSATVQVTIPGGAIGIPPDPATVAPTVDRTVASILANTVAFLYTGPNAIQTGVVPGTIKASRTAVLRGKVLDRNNQPLSGVQITILDHPEFGQTLSRADGMFDMVVNGGGILTLNYAKTGYLPSQRQLGASWQNYALAPDVMLVPLDAAVTQITLGAASMMQVARGSVSTDVDGSRQSTLIFPRGTSATMVLPDGSTQSLTQLSVRATEYTVGSNGPKMMPGTLPTTTGYTYAVELSVDQAIAAGAVQVRFNQRVYNYVENFLNFPIGGIVPAGYYDRQKGLWVPSDNGRVIKILSVANGMAILDVSGGGAAANAAMLGQLAITDDERIQLATLYTSGVSLWRVPLTHFTPWDYNWPFGGPSDAVPPPPDAPEKDKPKDKPDCKEGSIIGCQDQTLGEFVAVTGTPFNLRYRSDQVPGRKTGNRVTIKLSGPTVPPSLRRIDLHVSVAGRSSVLSFPPAPNQSYTYTWDGMDSYGRALNGAQPASARTAYIYDGRFLEPSQFAQSFGNLGGATTGSSRSNLEFILSREMNVTLGTWDARSQSLGGWTLTPRHAYDPVEKVLYKGDGTSVSADQQSAIITTQAGSVFSSIFTGEGGPATMASFRSPEGIAISPDGSVYFSSIAMNRVFKVNPQGIISSIAGNGAATSTGDGGPATAASFYGPRGIALDNQGNLFIAEFFGSRIRKVGVDGLISTVAGTGVAGYAGDGGAAISGQITNPVSVATAPDGSLYIADGSYAIRRISPSGVISTVAGNGTPALSGVVGGVGGPAVNARLLTVDGITLAPDGSLYFSDSQSGVFRIAPDGILSKILNARSNSLRSPRDLAFAADGTLHIVDYGRKMILRLAPDGNLMSIAGQEQQSGFSGDGGPARLAVFNDPNGIAIAPDGSLYIADYDNARIRRIAPFMPGVSDLADFFIASESGMELYHFDGGGRHLRTLSTKTNAVLYNFTYDTAGLLLTVKDGDNNTTVFERNAAGNPTAIIAHDGQRTTVSLDTKGYLTGITNPALETTAMTYNSEGLLTSFSGPKGNASTMQYDAVGRLVRDQNAGGGAWSVSRTEESNGYTAAMTSALNRTTSYRVETLPTGERRWTNTQPDGTRSQTLFKNDASEETTTVDGSIVITTRGPDPRFGMQSPVESSSVRLPSGLTSSSIASRTASLTDPNNPFSLMQETSLLTSNGRRFRSVYDVATRQYTDISAEGRITTTRTDPQGRPTFAQIAGVEAVNYNYDSRGRITGVTQGTGTDARSLSIGYGGDGMVETITDALTQQVAYQRDAAGRITQATLPGSRVVGFGFDVNSNVTSITPPGRTPHRFGRNAVDLEDTYTPPAAGLPVSKTEYRYNLDKQLTDVIRPDGTTITVSYDSGGRLGTITPTSGAGDTVTYGYYPDTGQLSTLANTSVTLGFTYDGALPKQENFSGTVNGNLTRSYDANFRVTGWALNGSNITLGYDRDSMLTSVGDMTLSRNSANGFLTGTTLGSVTTTQGYNAFGELTLFGTNVSGGPLYSYAFTYDKLGRIQTKTETLAGVTSAFEYGYDAVGRLETVKQGGVMLRQYRFDANSNRTNVNGIPIGTYDDQDRIQTYAGNAYTFGANGELKLKFNGSQNTQYSYDAFGNLTNVTLPDNTIIAYIVDGTNRRVGKKVNGRLTQTFLYQDQLRIAAELDGSGAIVSRFVYGTKINVPDYMIKGGVTYRIVTDHLGSVRLVVNVTSGAISQRIDYDEFGNVLLDTSPGFQPFGFAGGLYDPSTKLVRFGARDYEAETGRWVAKDPAGFNGGDSNLYAYVANDPVSKIDPFGLDPHTYTWRVFRCLGDCSGQTMAELRCNPAPGVYPKRPIQSADENDVGIPIMKIGAIISAVSPDTNTIFNLTMPGHLLHPGWVRRDVVVEGGSTWVVTTGGGDGFNPLNLNSLLAPLVWGGENPVRNNSANSCSCGR